MSPVWQPRLAPGEHLVTLIRRNETALTAEVYRWTGHFPEDSRRLLRHLAERADHLQLRYPLERSHRWVRFPPALAKC